MAKSNIGTSIIFTGDNLDIMEGLNSDIIDLIYIDPPFNSNAVYGAPIGGKKTEKIFKDIWTLQDVDLAWWGEIRAKNRPLYDYLAAVRHIHSKSMMSYLIYMAVRLQEMQRILKPTGSIYVHCDQHASRYLGTLMDAIFKRRNFRNELVWQRTQGKGLNPTRFLRNTDHIFLYGNGGKSVWNQPYIPFPPGHGDKWRSDQYGKWDSADLTGGKSGSPEAYMPFKGVNPPKKRAWAPPRREKFPKDVPFPADYENMSVQEKLHVLDDLGMIHWSRNGKPSYKKYLSTLKGIYRPNLITDIPPVKGKEAEDYPTQKPVALLKLLIEAASNPGDVVADWFCGCATTCVSAEMTGREWIGADLSEKAAELLSTRLGGELYTHRFTYLHDIPSRDDVLNTDILPLNQETKDYLFKRQAGYCFVCYDQFPISGLAIDHRIARKHKGNNHRSNLQLLCSGCNSRKGSMSMNEAVARHIERVGRRLWERKKEEAENAIHDQLNGN